MLQRAAGDDAQGRIFSFTYSVDSARAVRFLWLFAHGLHAHANQTFAAVDLIRTQYAPDDIVYGGGAWDYHELTADGKTVTDDVLPVAELRRAGMEQLLGFLEDRWPTRFWYRNNNCKQRFPAQDAGAGVQQLLAARREPVLETFNFSIAYWEDQTYDTATCHRARGMPSSRTWVSWSRKLRSQCLPRYAGAEEGATHAENSRRARDGSAPHLDFFY